jgi:Tfp pilus assembly protein FimT
MLRSISGLTKVELLVCLGVCSILGTGGVSAWHQVLPNFRMRSTIHEVYTVMQAARLFSIKENTEVSVCMVGGNRCEAFLDDGAGPGATAGNGIRESGEMLLCRRMIPPPVEVYKITFAAGRLRFNSRGMPRGAGSFYFRNRKGKYLGISVAVSGALSVKGSKDGGATWERL